MATILAKAAMLTVLAVISAVALIGLSGMIIFADISAQQPAALASDAIPAVPTVSGVNQ